jgi:tetratricopeptide (TPR) repeat protein
MKLLLALSCLVPLLSLRALGETHESHPAHPPASHDEPAAHKAPDPHESPPAHDAPVKQDAPSTHEVPAAPDAHDAHTDADAHVSVEEEIASLLRIGEAKALRQDWASALLAYNQVLVASHSATPLQVRTALLGLARTYRGDLRLTQACAVYERYIKEYPGDDQLPVVYLELGRCLRVLGAHRLAISRFYSVINSTLKLPEEGSDTYRQLARTAQFEIAETYFQSGDYEQAVRFYSRLSLLDLAPADRARAAFKSAYALNLKGNDDQAVTHLRSYISLYPDGENAAEARHLLALALRRLGRTQESLAATLELLKIESTRTAADPKTWSHWQRMTGNHLANSFYEQGDIITALTIYECMRELGGPPEWLIPVHYQIGLCQERLKQTALARTTYEGILTSLASPAAAEAKTPAILKDISNMVAWRLKHLTWLESIEKQSSLFTSPGVAAAPPVPPPSETALITP